MIVLLGGLAREEPGQLGEPLRVEPARDLQVLQVGLELASHLGVQGVDDDGVDGMRGSSGRRKRQSSDAPSAGECGAGGGR